MLNKIKFVPFSPLWVVLLTSAIAIYELQPARGDTTHPTVVETGAAAVEKDAETVEKDAERERRGDAETVEIAAEASDRPAVPDVSQPTAPATPTESSPPPPPTDAPPEAPTEPSQPAFPTEQPSQPSESPTAEEPKVLVVEVVVTGADRELENLVYNTVRTKPGRATTRSQLQEDLNAIYATGYFANVQVTPEDTPLGVRVTFAVQPNPILKQIAIDTVPADNKRVLPPGVVEETFREQYGKILNLRDLQEGIKKLNEWYSKNGYDLAQVVGAPQVAEDGTVTLVIAEGVVENIQVRFFSKEDEPVKGKTRDFIVTREMQLKPGDVFNRNTAQKDLQRIFGLGLFEDAKLSFSPGNNPQEVIVNVDIVEGNTGSLAAGAGISSTAGFFGTLSYQEQNLGGNNQKLGAEIQVGERELLFDVSFTDPWIGGDPYRTSYTANIFRRRTISLVYEGDNSSIRTLNGFDSPRVVRTGAGITFNRPLAENAFSKPDWRLSAGFSYQHVQIENANGATARLSAPLNGFDSQQLAFGPSGVNDLFIFSFGASQDRRDNPLQPTSGSLTRLGVEQTVPVGAGSIFFNRLRGSYSYYIPVKLINFDFTKGPQTLAFNVQAGTVFGDLPPYEAFVVGGGNSVRGYAEGEVGSGRSYFQATAEYRFPIFASVGGAVFFDYGTTLGSQDAVPGFPGVIRGLPGWGYGYGLGVRVQSPVGPLRVDYAVTNEGDSRIQFGIGEKF